MSFRGASAGTGNIFALWEGCLPKRSLVCIAYTCIDYYRPTVTAEFH